MPKSAKKRKDKAADFAKAKLKLGKGKQTPSNVIDTSFKARSIALPSQSIAVEKGENVPTTKRQQTFEDLISHLKHHNAGTRRDAVFGLRELLEENTEMMEGVLPSLMSAIVRLIGDEVRLKSNLSGLQCKKGTTVVPIMVTASDTTGQPHSQYAILRQLKALQDDIVPHSSHLLLYTTSAQTHIFPEIRVDAVRFLNLFLEHIPEVVVSGWDSYTNSHGSRILAGYLGILNAGTIYNDIDTPAATSTASVMLTPQRAPSEEGQNFHFLASSFTDSDAYLAFESTLEAGCSTRMWKPLVGEHESFIGNYALSSSPTLNSWTLDDLAEIISTSESSDAVLISLVSKLATALHPTLTSTFLDFSPTVFSPSNPPPETDLNLIQAVVEISRALYVGLLSSSVVPQSCVDELSAILNYMAPFFPFTASGRRDIKVERTLQELNLHYCDMVSHLVSAMQAKADASTKKAKGTRATLSKNLDDQMTRVRDYVLQVLGGTQTNTTSLTSTAYASLLPTIWSFINVAHTNNEKTTVFQMTLEHATRLTSKSAMKRCSSDFIARLILVRPHRNRAALSPLAHKYIRLGSLNPSLTITAPSKSHAGQRRIGSSKNGSLISPKSSGRWDQTTFPHPRSVVQTKTRLFCQLNSIFLSPTPKGHSSIPDTFPTTPSIASYCHTSYMPFSIQTLTALRTRLVPFFIFSHAERGQVLGPYTKLPPFSPNNGGTCIRRLVLSMVATLLAACKSDSSSPSDSDLVNAVSTATSQNPSEQEYWQKLSLSVL
ncbi:rRNA processing protein [Paramarasmius palmivorus]|uniref:Pre-rRNA-processing protein n=1 Tax=Paramarasmius palmivorus TaxID=297713 RepID=A0AAW0E4H3_9AGAR